MNMKRLLYVIGVLLVITSCGGTKIEQPDLNPLELKVDKQKLEFTAAGGTLEFTVSAQYNPNLSPWEKWYTLEKGTWENNRVTVKVNASANTETKERTGKISVVSGDQKLYVEIVQGAGDETGGGTNTGTVPKPTNNAAWKMARKLGMGWNLGNHFDAHINGVSGETLWGNSEATQETFNKIKAAGFETVRIPVTWLGHIGEAPEYKIEEAWLDRVAEVVGYAEKAGLNVIINMHHDGADSKYWLNIASAAVNPAVHKQIIEQIDAMWTQIAEKFRDKGDWLIFEAFNEIHDGKWGWRTEQTEESSTSV